MVFSASSAAIPGFLPSTLRASLWLFKFVAVKFVCGEGLALITKNLLCFALRAVYTTHVQIQSRRI